MITIETLDDKLFSFNGVSIPKNYEAQATGVDDSLEIISTGRDRDVLQNSKKYDEFEINGIVPSSLNEAITLINEIVFSNGGGAGVGAQYIYSFNEELIGTFFDKPLFRKCFDFSFEPQFFDYFELIHNCNIKNYIKHDIVLFTNALYTASSVNLREFTTAQFGIGLDGSELFFTANKIQFENIISGDGFEAIIVLEYTKNQ